MNEKRYLKTYVLVLAVLAVPLLSCWVFDLRMYELAPYREIVAEQQRSQAIYGSALNTNDLKYKVELAAARDPETVVIGSSRTMLFRERAFRERFTNCSGTFTNLNEGRIFTRMLFSRAHPRTVFLGLDYWWFSKTYHSTLNRSMQDETTLTAQKLLHPLEWMFTGRLPVSVFFRGLARGVGESSTTSWRNLGIFANRDSNGWRPDGSYFDATSILLHSVGDLMRMKEDELRGIEAGANRRYSDGTGDFVDPGRVDAWLELVAYLQTKGARVIPFLPPVSPMLLDHARETQTKYVSALVEAFRKRGIPLHDLTALKGTSDEEFLDLWHPGEIADLRLLRELARLDSAARETLDLSVIDFALREPRSPVLWVQGSDAAHIRVFPSGKL